ncbi:hypothetical protein [Corallococcus sicarius]|nr:hypothetical protein [Corallococcus sicarius]
MSQKNLKVLVSEAVHELLREHSEVARRVREQRAQGLAHSPEDGKRLRVLNDMINPLVSMSEALKHAAVPTPDDVDKILETLKNGVERLKDLKEDLSSDE